MNRIKSPNYCVTTGKCNIPLWKDYELFDLKDQFEDTFRQFVVCGSNFSNHEIYEYDNIFCFYTDSSINGQFVVVKTNRDLYENIIFDYMLRKSLLYIDGGEDIEDIIEDLKDKDVKNSDFPQIHLEKTREQLRTLYKKTTDVTKYDDLILSYTYDCGNLLFSLDRADDVVYDVNIVIPVGCKSKRIHMMIEDRY